MDTLWRLPQNKSTYILRYYLPYTPYTDRDTTRKRLYELIAYCRRSNVEAVMFYCNFIPNWIYMPDTMEHSLEYAEAMKEYAQFIRKAGISYQINFQLVLGAHTGNTDMRSLYNWEYLVDHRGVEIQGCACPQGSRFRSAMSQELKAWAATKPDVMWIDDDLRMHNHQDGSYFDWYCYCDLHLQRFSDKIGRKYTREELVNELVKPSDNSRVRNAWLDFLNETMSETALWISNTVHEVSPDTRIAQMISVPDVHAAEGRNWKDFLVNISGEGYTPAVRPHFGPYTETMPLEFINSYTLLDQTMKNISIQYPGKVDHCPEIENTRFTRWAKTVEATRYQLRLGQLLGCPGITLSIYDIEGSPLSEEPAYEKLLTDEKAPLDRIAELGLAKWRQRGVGLLTDPELGRKIQVNGEDDVSALLGPGRMWDKVLLQMGTPAFYVSPDEAAENEVVAMDGTTAWLPDDDEMGKILSKGVLLDSNAAKVLIERGYGKDIGIKAVSLRNHTTGSEIFLSGVLESMPAGRMPLRIKKGKWHVLVPSEDSKILSTLIDPMSVTYPGTIIYENSVGGRIATYAGCVDPGVEFFNHQRIKWLNALLDWLSRGSFPINIYPEQRLLTIRRDSRSATLLAFANFTADCLEQVRGVIKDARVIKSVKYLSNEGQWKATDTSFFESQPDGGYEFRIPAKLNLYNWMVVVLEYMGD